VSDASTEEALYAAVELARHAPSLHNAQPWRWRIAGLYADTARAVPVADPLGRELRLSCGAALEHAKIALAAAGWHVILTRLPDPSRPDLIARIHLAGRVEPAAHTVQGGGGAVVRRTTRLGPSLTWVEGRSRSAMRSSSSRAASEPIWRPAWSTLVSDTGRNAAKLVLS
jgi:hypothetical protein